MVWYCVLWFGGMVVWCGVWCVLWSDGGGYGAGELFDEPTEVQVSGQTLITHGRRTRHTGWNPQQKTFK